MYNTIIFDLDGTLTDSAEGITKSVRYALVKMAFFRSLLPGWQLLVPMSHMRIRMAGILMLE